MTAGTKGELWKPLTGRGSSHNSESKVMPSWSDAWLDGSSTSKGLEIFELLN
jgi:hypothetical protein